MSEENKIKLPPDDIKWEKNNSRSWPKLMYEDLVDYLISSKAYDGKEMKAFRALYAYNYVENGWMGDIYNSTVDGIHFVKATVSPSQPGVGRIDYKSWIAVSEDNVVLTCHCTCPAGNGRSCSHVSAVIYAVTLAWKYGMGGETCTDKEIAWGKGASKVLSHDQLSDMNFEKHNPVSTSSAKTKTSEACGSAPLPQQFLDHADLEKFVGGSSVKDLWACKGTILYEVLNAPVTDVEETVPLHHGCHKSGSPDLVSQCEPCKTVYKKFVDIGTCKYSSLTTETESQNSSLWIDSRKFRITASRTNSLPKSSRGDPSKVVNGFIFNRFKGCAATRHGQKSEPLARRWFEDKTGLTVAKCGIVVHPDKPYIAASPDGLIGEDSIIEIKCPTRPLKDLIESGKYDIIIQDRKMSLNPKGKNGYYCQVQMTMYCTGRKFCKFVAWTENYSVVVDVTFDSEYVEKLLPRIRDFYFIYMLPRLADELHYKRLRISSEYRGFCEANDK